VAASSPSPAVSVDSKGAVTIAASPKA
jgi:hypothetical protein